MGMLLFIENFNEKRKLFFIDKSNLTIQDLNNSKPAAQVGITKEKENDVKQLLRYLTPNGQTFFNNFFKKSKRKRRVIND